MIKELVEEFKNKFTCLEQNTKKYNSEKFQ